ncbi:MAG: hypothetical protein L0Y72_18620 [Gemmataceae bacterium]|nr:hypothetical protein [Gemmataceae bacterium]MCI0741062.1 hypothetical protein [Gemmataceae bacterium]
MQTPDTVTEKTVQQLFKENKKGLSVFGIESPQQLADYLETLTATDRRRLLGVATLSDLTPKERDELRDVEKQAAVVTAGVYADIHGPELERARMSRETFVGAFSEMPPAERRKARADLLSTMPDPPPLPPIADVIADKISSRLARRMVEHS